MLHFSKSILYLFFIFNFFLKSPTLLHRPIG